MLIYKRISLATFDFAALLIDWLGATRVVLAGAIVNVIGTLLTPFVAQNLGPYVLLIVRFFMGAGQGILVPCTSVLIALWFPVTEKAFAVGVSTAGNQVTVTRNFIGASENSCSLERQFCYSATQKQTFSFYSLLFFFFCVFLSCSVCCFLKPILVCL